MNRSESRCRSRGGSPGRAPGACLLIPGVESSSKKRIVRVHPHGKFRSVGTADDDRSCFFEKTDHRGILPGNQIGKSGKSIRGGLSLNIHIAFHRHRNSMQGSCGFSSLKLTVGPSGFVNGRWIQISNDGIQAWIEFLDSVCHRIHHFLA